MIFLWIGVGICAVLAVFLFVWVNNSALTTTRYKIKLNGLEKDVRIAHISDLHGKSFGRDNVRLLSEIQNEKPDFIVITGDIIHKYTERNKRVALRLVSALSALAPVYYCSGNHEMRKTSYRFFRRDLKEAGAVVLDDESVRAFGLNITGLNCASQKNGTAKKIAPENGDGLPKILLAHKPHFIEEYAGYGYDVILSGHAHGGQWRIPFTGVGIYSPGQGLFPKYTSGVHTSGNTKEVISRGLGNSECPLRLFNLPELVIVELEKY